MEDILTMVNDETLSCMLEGVPNKVYHAAPGVSKSNLDKILVSPLHYRSDKENPRKETPAMALGTAVHTAILEPAEFTKRYAVPPKINRRTNAGKAEWQEWLDQGFIPLEVDEWASIMAMRDSFMANSHVQRIMSAGIPELSVFHYDPEFPVDDDVIGIRHKIRPDWFNADLDVILDVKTSKDASPDGFGRSAGNFNYHMQAAYYSDVMRKRTGRQIRAFIFGVVETAPPYAMALYVLDDEALVAGRNRYKDALDVYAWSQQMGDWPGYSQEPETLIIPNWAL